MRIDPIKKFKGTFFPAKDKSITQRSFLFGSIADGITTVKNPLLSEDTLSCLNAIKSLGAKVEQVGDVIKVTGTDSFLNDIAIDCGNSGTLTRLLMGILVGKNIRCQLTGDFSLTKRPMKRVIEPLTMMGGNIMSKDGFLPINILNGQAVGIDYSLPVLSAQVKSSILLCGLNTDETIVREKAATRNHTELMLKDMGADIAVLDNVIKIKRSKLKGIDVEVPSDISSASFLIALGLLHDGGVILKDVSINETRTGLLDVLEKMDAKIEKNNVRYFGSEKVCDLTIEKSRLKGVVIKGDVIPRLIDEIPILAVLASFADGETVIEDAEELRYKECDRITAMSNALKKCGVKVETKRDGLKVFGQESVVGGENIETYKDHRIAMSMAILGTASKNGVSVIDGDCVNVSFPQFYDVLKEGTIN